ncbi:MAG: ferrous iron transport protein B [Actinomycetes bacterium]|jgi:ferrous iron transport protein B|nr:ferrous iron transport protein B [Actinomycetes bacterium]
MPATNKNKQNLTIALAGNPNSGKTTLFNRLTGSTQRIGNWPGVTVEKKEGRVRGRKEIELIDLPGVYSLSPYTLEEVVSRDFLVNEEPDAIINIVDASNIERNLYLTTQLLDIGIPVVVALNMMDIVNKRGDIIDVTKLQEKLGCPVVEISATKGFGISTLVGTAFEAAHFGATPHFVRDEKGSEIVHHDEVVPEHRHQETHFERQFSAPVEAAVDEIATIIKGDVPVEHLRWYAIKYFERDTKVLEASPLPADARTRIEAIITRAETKMNDVSTSIITGESYDFISGVVADTVTKKNSGMTISDKIDSIVTSRILGLPIFVLVMFLVYYVSVTTIGTIVTDFTNDTFVGTWIQEPIASWLGGTGMFAWLQSLIVDGIVGGVGAVIGFVPQMLILFLFLALLEDCGYMARIAFLMDRIFRRFGMSGKSFIPLLIGTGCGVPGIMATRTIEQDRDRRMTIMTTTFMPCGAKLPFIALIAGVAFGGAWWVAPSAYFLGIGSVIVSGIILKKTKLFSGDPAPFVMELPAYHFPVPRNVFYSVWERGSAFIKRATTFILLTSIAIWFLSSFGFEGGGFGMVDDLNNSVAANLGNLIAWIFSPLGFGNWKAAIASVLGLAAKEEIVSVMGVLTSISGEALDLVEEGAMSTLNPIMLLFGGGATTLAAAYSFLVFNLLCVPCFAAVSTMASEMKSAKWSWLTVGYQCGWAYAIAFIVYRLWLWIGLSMFSAWTVVALVVLAALLFLLFRPQPKNKEVSTSTPALSKG